MDCHRPEGLRAGIEHDHAVIVCAINLGYWDALPSAHSILEHDLEDSTQLVMQIRLHQLIALVCSVLDDNKSIPH